MFVWLPHVRCSLNCELVFLICLPLEYVFSYIITHTHTHLWSWLWFRQQKWQLVVSNIVCSITTGQPANHLIALPLSLTTTPMQVMYMTTKETCRCFGNLLQVDAVVTSLQGQFVDYKNRLHIKLHDLGHMWSSLSLRAYNEGCTDRRCWWCVDFKISTEKFWISCGVYNG
jgi:hypothetical protein